MLKNISQLAELGGPILLLLLVLSIAGVAIVLYKWAQLRTFGRRRLARIVRRLQNSPQTLGNPQSPVEQLIADALHGGPSQAHEIHRSAIVQRAAALVADLGAGLRTLELIAYIAPLLGLLGTVVGMIEAFRSLDAAGPGQPGTLAEGIWEALLTTAAGLSVAIPLAVAHGLLDGRLRDFTAWLENTLEYALVNGKPKPADDPGTLEVGG